MKEQAASPSSRRQARISSVVPRRTRCLSRYGSAGIATWPSVVPFIDQFTVDIEQPEFPRRQLLLQLRSGIDVDSCVSSLRFSPQNLTPVRDCSRRVLSRGQNRFTRRRFGSCRAHHRIELLVTRAPLPSIKARRGSRARSPAARCSTSGQTNERGPRLRSGMTSEKRSIGG